MLWYIKLYFFPLSALDLGEYSLSKAKLRSTLYRTYEVKYLHLGKKEQLEYGVLEVKVACLLALRLVYTSY